MKKTVILTAYWLKTDIQYRRSFAMARAKYLQAQMAKRFDLSGVNRKWLLATTLKIAWAQTNALIRMI